MIEHSKYYTPVLVALSLACGTGAVRADVPIVDAARTGDAAAVRALIRQRTDVNVAEADGSTALLWAVYRAELETVKALIAARADVNAANRYGLTPLLQASRLGSAAMIEALLKAGADPGAAVREGETPLMAAAGAGTVEGVRLLLARGEDVNARESAQDQTALMWAAAEGHLAVVQTLLAAGADPNRNARPANLSDANIRESGRQWVDYSRGGLSPLMFAAREGHLEVAAALLKAGANPNYANPDKITSMLLAVVNDRFDLADVLLQNGASANDGSLYETVRVHNLRMDATASDATRPRPNNDNRLNPVEFAARLLDKGADPNRVIEYTLHAEGYGFPRAIDPTAYAYASALQSQDVEMLRMLLGKQAVDPNAVSSAGVTPLMAVSVGVGRGGIFSNLGEGNFRFPGERGAVPAATLLIDNGADVNLVTPNGETAMHRAAQNGDVPLIRFLAARGAKLDVRSMAGLTPLDLAMGKQAPARPGPSGETTGFPNRNGPKPEAIAALRELLGMPADKDDQVLIGASGVGI